MNPVRKGAVWAYRILITLFALAVLVEFVMAGLSVFRAMPGEDVAVSHSAFDEQFDAHATLGWYLAWLSLLLVITILVAWTGLPSIGATLALGILSFVQPTLAMAGEEAPAAGAFHAVNALVILLLSGFLALRAWRGTLFLPPAQLRASSP